MRSILWLSQLSIVLWAIPCLASPMPQPVAQTNGSSEPTLQVVEVLVVDPEGKSLPPIRKTAYDALPIRPGAIVNRSEVEAATNALFATGFFVNVQAQPENTPLGIRLRFIAHVQPPP